MSSSNPTSIYAANSAATSLKRARHLFQETTPFVPVLAEDYPLGESAVARRRRQRRGVFDSSGAIKSSGDDSRQLVTASSIVPTLKSSTKAAGTGGGVLTTTTTTQNGGDAPREGSQAPSSSRILTTRPDSKIHIPNPTWHSPWKLSTVLSSHLGWVRSIAMDPENKLFATGSADRTIKVWNLPKAAAGAEDALQLTLTGHISAVRGLVFSDRHPYLFSVAEDKTVKCWDLETNQVVRHYHGHLSGVYAISLHPTLDVLVTAGRDAVARVWDIRTKTQLHVLSGHEHTVSSVLTSSTHPHIVTGSHDCTVKLWDLAAGKCFTTLTHHAKSIRALAAAPPALGERTFCSAAADSIRKWQGKNGKYLSKMTDHADTVLNAVAVQDDGVMVSGGDDGSMRFWDYKSGHNFQTTRAVAQPGSLDAENGIMALSFDLTGTRLITGEADKSIKIWKQDEAASELSHPIDTKAWRKKCIAASKERY